MSVERVCASPRASAGVGRAAGARGGDSELDALRLGPPPVQTESGHPGCREPSLCRQRGQVSDDGEPSLSTMSFM